MGSVEKSKPRGRDSVRNALVEAGAALFAGRGTHAVSVREVAKMAGVNHGLIHRHFGSKRGLVRAIMAQLADDVFQRMGTPVPDEKLSDVLVSAFRATQGGGLHWKILTRALLDGEDPRELQSAFPVVERLLVTAKRDNPSSLSDEALVTLIVAVALGLLVFEPYLRVATGQDEERWQATRRELIALAMKSVGG